MTVAYRIKDDSAVVTQEYFRVYFFRNERPQTLTEKIQQRAVNDYYRSFGYDSVVSHCAIELNGKLYEVSLNEGTQVYAGGDHILTVPTLVSYWEIDLTGMDYESTVFMLNSLVDRKLDWKGSLKYLANFFFNSASTDIKYGMFPLLNYCLPYASISRGGDKLLEFHLPYTCATLAAIAIDHLFHLEPAYDSHLPPTIYMSCNGLAKEGYGEIFDRLDALERYGIQ